MRNFYRVLLAASMWVAPAFGQETFTLAVRVEGLSSTAGLLHYALYAATDEFPSRRGARFRGEIPIDRLDFTFDFVAVPAGDYALILAHDEDGDGEIATPGLLNPFRGEPVGVSNYDGRLYRSPSFERARFTVGAARPAITIRLFRTGIF